MRIVKLKDEHISRTASMALGAHQETIIKEAMSRRDIMATILSLSSFLMLPLEIRMATSLKDWISQRGGSIETAKVIAHSVGKPDPNQVSMSDLKLVTPSLNQHTTSDELPHPYLKQPEYPEKDINKIPTKTPVVKTKPIQLSEDSYWGNKKSTHENELTPDIQQNAMELFRRVNALLKELGVERAVVSSGWRPRSYNEELRRRGIPAAKNSQHTTGQAVDLSDPKQTISQLVMRDPSILDKHGLWMEDPSRTRTWVHFDLGANRNPKRYNDGSPRKNRVFKP